MVQTNCIHFNGYKPCGLSEKCDSNCPHLSQIKTSILIVHLGAIGAVLRSTALLSAINRKYPKSKITWVTEKICKPLLQNHPRIHQVIANDPQELVLLSNLVFDVSFVIDKSAIAVAIAKLPKAVKKKYGFAVQETTGAIIPETHEAQELWDIGLSDFRKFYQNKKSEAQLVHEALGLGTYVHDEYDLPLNEIERNLAKNRRQEFLSGFSNSEKALLIGINTGCSPSIPYKKLSIPFHRKLIQNLSAIYDYPIVLLGGPEDTERNALIADGFKKVICSPTELGLRDGLVSIAACDVIISGDSLGMHMAISQKKYVIAWFGPTCQQEINLYGRGKKLITSAPCAPCWKRSCHQPTMCYDLVSLSDMIRAVDMGIRELMYVGNRREDLEHKSSRSDGLSR